jgi:hypothetical protein
MESTIAARLYGAGHLISLPKLEAAGDSKHPSRNSGDDRTNWLKDSFIF